MDTAVINTTEYRNLPLALLTESTTNPRRVFEENSLKELAETIRTQGVLSPLLVRPLNERSFEIVFGARRFRAAQMAEVETVPVRIREMSDAEVLEAQLIENLQRRDVHPMEEAQGFRSLLSLEEPAYSIEQIAAKVGKSPAYVAQRVKLTELTEAVVESFYRDEIGVGHALLLAKLPADKQQEALTACFREDWSASTDRKAKRILLPVRSLQFWIEQNILLTLKDAPFDKRDAQLVASAGSCTECAKRTGHNKLLFADLGKQDSCTDSSCYQAKVGAHIAKAIAAKPKLVQISTSYAPAPEDSTVLPRRKYVPIRGEKPKDKDEAQRPEYKVCKFTTEAIIAEGEGKGSIHKVCAEPNCPVHHPKKQMSKADASFKAQQEKQRREAAIAHAIGLRTLAAIRDAVPVRLMKRDLLFITERLASMVDDDRLSTLARLHGIKKVGDGDSVTKLFLAYLRRAEEGELGRALVELTIALAAARSNGAHVLSEAAAIYKLDAQAIALKVKQEFAAREKQRRENRPSANSATKKIKKTA
jgi:ParB family chromosome partitioning protein